MFYNSNKICFRTPKQCRERWLNHLDTTKKRGAWSIVEDNVIFKYIRENGKHWSKIIPLLNHTRTEHMIKNRYNSVVSKLINTNKITHA
jgi:Myb-like DNA-binding protein FlbD